MVNTGAQSSSIVCEDACETKPIVASVENASLPPQMVQEQSLHQQNLEDADVEQVPTQLEMFKQLREMQSRLKSTEEALVDCKKELERRSDSKREADGPSGPSKKFKDGKRKSKVDSRIRYCWKCHANHVGECSRVTIRCRHCGEMGHVAQDCRSEVKCFNCQESGHMSVSCPKAKVELKSGNKKAKIRMS